MVKLGFARNTIRGFISPGELKGEKLRRIVHQTLDRAVTEQDRDAILALALDQAELQAIPDRASQLVEFTYGPLRSAIGEVVDPSTAETVVVSLAPVLEQACRQEGSVSCLPSDDAPTQSQPPPNADAPSILVVEYDIMQRAQIAKMLRIQGYAVVAAPDGHIALAMSMRRRPDLVLAADVLPAVGGGQLMALLQVAFSSDAPPVVIMATDPSARIASEAAAVVRKPVTTQALLEAIEPIVGRPGTTPPPESAPPTTRPR